MLIPDLEAYEWRERAGWFSVPRYGTWYAISMRNCDHVFLLNLVPFWQHCPSCHRPTAPSVSYEVLRG